MALVEPEVPQGTPDVALFLVPGVDLRELSAAPAEAFVLACIDGRSTQAEIALTTGLSVEAVARIVDSLVARAAVGFAPPQSARQAVAPSAQQSGAYAVAGGASEQRLDLSREQPARSASSSSIPAPPSRSGRAVEDLKQRYEQRLARARDEQREHYVTLSNEAAARNDLVAAANALRVACSLALGNLELAGDLAELERRAAAGMWESYAERGKYAALEGRPAEAAEAYERAAIGHPNASLYERAAFYLLEAQGDVKRAAALAKQAVALAPNSARCHLVLARVYAAAKLRDSALAELERARAIEPGSVVVKEWIQRVKRGDF
ncbi:MAG: tetratricopeptide repeat protein [Polyangiaceae bacterium]